MALLSEMGLPVHIWPVPVEIPDPIGRHLQFHGAIQEGQSRFRAGPLRRVGVVGRLGFLIDGDRRLHRFRSLLRLDRDFRFVRDLLRRMARNTVTVDLLNCQLVPGEAVLPPEPAKPAPVPEEKK